MRCLRILSGRLPILFRYWSTPDPSDAFLRHVVPKYLTVDGVITADAFSLKPNEESLSWTRRVRVLLTSEGLDDYQLAHQHNVNVRHPETKKKVSGQRKPGLMELDLQELKSCGVAVRWDPVWNATGRLLRFAFMHYASDEPGELERVALAGKARHVRSYVDTLNAS